MLVDIAEEAVQLEASERLPEGIDLDTLRKYFTLTTEDLEEVEQCRGAINKLGFAVQLCTLRWQGYFLRETRGVPLQCYFQIVAYQLGLLAIPIEDYPQKRRLAGNIWSGSASISGSVVVTAPNVSDY